MLKEDKIVNGYAADDCAGAHFIDGNLVRAVSSLADAKVYKVGKIDGKVTEMAIETDYLG